MKNQTDLGFLTAADFIKRRSATLIDSPSAKLQEEYEVNRYLSSLDHQYSDEVKSLSLSDSQPCHRNVRAIITIIAYNEGSKIRKTLDNYLEQDLDPELFEIIILDNHPHNTEGDNTRSEVENFKKDSPNISVIYAHKTWGADELATVGNARKYVFDIALARLLTLGSREQDTILVSNDADTVSLQDNYLSSIISEFDTNKTVEALVTLSVVPISTLLKPNVYAALSLWDALDEIVADGEPYNLIGRSSAYRASIYSAVGGYNPKGKMAGDLETGFLIADARGWNPDCIIQLKKTRHVQDPRRILEAVATRTPVNEMYYQFVSNPEIRNADNDTLSDLIPNDLDWELLEEDVDSFWGGRMTGMYKWRGTRFESDYAKAMERIGIEFKVVDNRVKITNIDKLLSGYEEFSGGKVAVFHSEPREWDQKRMDAMKEFFFSVTDSAIACRENMAENIAEKIQLAIKEGETAELDNLLSQFKRFAGHDYPQA